MAPAYMMEATFDVAFERILDKIMEKYSFEEAVRDDHRNLKPAEVMRWIMALPDRKARYYEALEIRAELISEDLLGIADGKDDMDDIERAKLRINERRKQMAIWNRKRFGEVKQVDITSSVSISAAIDEANNRIAMLDNVTDVSEVGEQS